VNGDAALSGAVSASLRVLAAIGDISGGADGRTGDDVPVQNRRSARTGAGADKGLLTQRFAACSEPCERDDKRQDLEKAHGSAPFFFCVRGEHSAASGGLPVTISPDPATNRN